jgi:hypothetical protein
VSLPPLRVARRATALLAAAGALGAMAAAPAPARMYISTSTQLGAEPSGSVEGYAYVAAGPNADSFQLDVVRDGVTVATQTGQSYVAVTPFVPQAGDEIALTDLTTSERRVVTVSGRPTLDASLCGAPAAFAGDRDDGAAVTVGASLSYGTGDPRNESLTLPQIFGLGMRFAGSFPRALGPDWAVTAKQARAVDASLTVFEAVSRPVGDCPPAEVPPPAPAPGPAPAPAPAPAPLAAPVKDLLPPGARLALAAALRRPAAAYRALLRGRFAVRVSVTEPGLVRQTLYLDDGARLPAATAAARRAARRPAVLGAGRAAAARPGDVEVTVKLSKNGRRALGRRRRVKVALVTVVTDAAGNARVLAPRRLTLTRAP